MHDAVGTPMALGDLLAERPDHDETMSHERESEMLAAWSSR